MKTALKLPSLLAFAFAIATPALRSAEVYWGGGTGAITDDNWYSDAGLTTLVTPTAGDSLNIASGTLSIVTTATVYETGIGLGPGDNAAVIVSGTWNNTNAELSIGGSAAPSPDAGSAGSIGSLTVLAGGTVRGGTFYIGNNGSGVLHIAEGGQITNSANAWMGRNTGGSGTATIEGQWNVGGYIIVGGVNGSHGNLITVGPTGAVTVNNNYLAVANTVNTSGTVDIQGSLTGYTYLRVAGHNTAPGNAVGELIISGYASDNGATDAITCIGWRGSETEGVPASVGVLRVTETGTLIVSSSETTLGHYGMASAATYLTNASGTVIISGVWKNAGVLRVGRSGAGYLEVTPSGTVIVDTFAHFGSGNSNRNLNYTATGPVGGTVVINGFFKSSGTDVINSIGYSGNTSGAPGLGAIGTLTIGPSGTVIFSGTETSLGHLGLASGATYYGNASGTAFVEGFWQNAGNLLIGRSGAGYLEIRPSGTVTVGTHLSVAVSNSGSNATGKTTGPQGGRLIVNGHLAVGAHATVGSADMTTASVIIGENGVFRTGTNGDGQGYFQVGRNGSTAGSGTAAPVTGTSVLQVDGLLDIGGNFNFGMRSTSALTLGAEGNILVAGNYYQSPQTLLAFTPGSSRDLALAAAAKAAYLSGTLKLTGLGNLSGYATAASATTASALPSVTVVSAAAGIEGEFTAISITPALTGTTGLPDYVYNGRVILGTGAGTGMGAGNGPAEYRVGQLLAWHAPAANAHGTFTIGIGSTFAIDIPLADRFTASAFASGWDGKSLAKKGPGTLVLAASASRTGDTTIESGTLRIATDGLSLGNLVNNAVLDLGGSAAGYHTATAATLAGSGTIILSIANAAATGAKDTLTITGNATGAHALLVSINGASPVAASPAQITALVTVTGNNTATFDGTGMPSSPTVTFSPQGGSVTPAQQAVTGGVAYGTLPTPVLAGATFAGWFTAPNGGTLATASTAAPASSHVLYARWIDGGHPVITPGSGKDLYGSIIDDTGAPVPNVVVSDGFTCVKTNANGIYQMTRNAKARVVFYSTPETHAINTLGPGTGASQTGYAWFSQKLTPDVKRYNFNLTRLPAPETDFMLLGIGDPQVTSLAQLKRYETETIADIGKLRETTPAGLPIYAIMLGDIVGDNLHLHAPLRDIVNASPITYFSVLGNHDQDQAYSNLNKDYESGEAYENIYGPLNYSVNIGDVHIIGLDNVLYTRQDGYGTGLTADILEWVKQDLSHVPKTKTIIVAYHIPLRGGTAQNAQALFNLLKDYADVHFFAGHTHYQENVIFNITGAKTIAAQEHIHGGACGAWWNSLVNTDGAPNGYGVYTISGTQFTDWYSHPTGYSDTYQMRMYKGNTVFGVGSGTYSYKRTANDVVVDVWNADKNWKFAVYENNILVSSTLAKMATMPDAYAAGYHVGVLGRAAGGNYDSNNNKHLYLHTLRTPGASVEIRATDPFGKTYTLSHFTTDLSEFPANFASPAITAQPEDATVTVGQTAAFTAVVSGTPSPSLKWQSSPTGTTWTDVPNATTAALSIPATTALMNGMQYRFVASNVRGNAASAAATLTVNSPPAITTQPANATRIAGETATFTVVANGNPAPSYQWQSSPDGSAWTNISGATSATLTLTAVTTTMSGVRYRCIATNSLGAATSNAATLTVNSAPVIITHPSNATHIAGETATFTVVANGTPAPTYQWQSSPNGSTWTPVSGATSATLTLATLTTTMSGVQYRCMVTNSVASATSNAALLTVNPNPATVAAEQLKAQLEASGAAPVTVTGTIDLSLVGGATITSGKTISGADASATIAGGLKLAAGARDAIILGINFTGGTFVIDGVNDVTVSHCTFTNTPVSIIGGSDNVAFSWNKFAATPSGGGSAMTISNAGPVTGILLDHNLWDDGLRADMPAVTNARVLMFNNYLTATGNNTATIAGAGAQILSVRNIYQGVSNPITKQSTGLLRTLDNSMTATPGTTAPGDDKVFVPGYSHIVDPGDSATAAEITASAGNTAGKDSVTPASTGGTASISATVSGPGATANTISATVPTGGGFTLTANASGFAPSARQWYLDNFAISSATAATYAVANASAAGHTGAYSVAMTAGTGDIVNSGAFTVTVAALAAPVITTHPASKTVTVGESATFTVVATGESLTYQWMKGGAAIAGATSANYTVTDARQSDAGSYTVRVSNSAGSVTSNAATLTVNVPVLPPPVITTHPASRTVTVGESATFTVVATGESLDYQWMKGGAAIAGATSASYTVTNAQQSHAGSYTVRVGNTSGSVTSNAAALTVNPAGGGNNGGNTGGGGGGGGGLPSPLFFAALALLFVFRKVKR